MSKLRRNSKPSDVNQAAYVMVQRTTEESEQPKAVKASVKVPAPSKAEISRVMSIIGRKG